MQTKPEELIEDSAEIRMERIGRVRSIRKLVLTGLVLLLCSLAICGVSVRGFTLLQWCLETHSDQVRWQADSSGNSSKNGSEKLVALTFDDGPDSNYTPRVEAILERYGVRATFFEEGCMVARHPELTRSLVAHGHSIGSHTYSHPPLTRLSRAQIREEIEGGQRTLATDAGVISRLFRPPYGEWNDAVFQEAKRAHVPLILWTVALEHHEVPTPEAMAARALRLIRPGGILLMHDGKTPPRETTVQALPLLLEGLRQRGYRCVTIPVLLGLKE